MTLNVCNSSQNGCTALYIAAGKGKLDCLAALLSAGADLNMQNNVSVLLILNLSSYQDGDTALYRAAYQGHVECIAALLSAGADLNSQDNVSYFR